MKFKPNKIVTQSLTDFDSSILQNEAVAWQTHRLRLTAPECARLAKPGQFVNIRINRTLTPFLRRPFSIHQCNPHAGWIEILFDIRGAGTQLLAQSKPGTSLSLLGPAGQSFQWPANLKRARLIAGGLGIAPMFFLAQILAQQKIDVSFYYGAKSRRHLCCLNELEALTIALNITTDDGSNGQSGLVTEVLQADFSPAAPDFASTLWFACGPNAMLRVVQQMALAWGISAQLSLETMMGCGFGVCVGCAVQKSTPANAAPEYYLVCQDGPVFAAEEVIIPD
ncbi:dihydroorotate dehydrogenase electron transfer subunit [candidate division KSB1 bacterium]|nr:dihydroorotate dehydrogenase electron transfer subunit [candidate division KSB1 bacterium]